MRSTKAITLAIIVATALVATMEMASADTINIVSVASWASTGTSSTPGFTLLNLGTTTLPCYPCGPGNGNQFQTSSTILSPGGDISSISFSSGNPASGEYSGNGSGFSSPFGASNGTTNFLVAGGNNSGQSSEGVVTITYSTPQTQLDLLWGTVDNAPQNDVSITVDGVTVTGTQVLAAASTFEGSSQNSGADDVGVEITGLAPFTVVQFIDDASPSFEFVPGVGTVAVTVPEPASLALFGVALCGFGLIRRRRRNVA